jgi:hypothetical protein
VCVIAFGEKRLAVPGIIQSVRVGTVNFAFSKSCLKPTGAELFIMIKAARMNAFPGAEGIVHNFDPTA